ncbi:MAG TPA: hypothetical protein VMT71_16265 [Syntrophorhabdales bacterium]|nr:hypothetical protein [Syntrophorhabdales bacterium]
MHKDKNWFYVALGVIALAFATVGLSNYVLDPYGLFRKDFSWQFVEPNSNFIKVRYVTEYPDRYDCFLFGSSRVGNIDVRAIKNFRCYNMTCNGGLPHEFLNNLRYMLKRGVRPKLVLVGLDDFSFKSNPAERLSQPLRHPYPPVLNESPLPFYLRYLFSLHSQHIMSPVIEGYWRRITGKGGSPAFFWDITNTGQLLVPGVDKYIDEHAEEYRKDPKFTEKIESVTGDNMKGAIEDISEMVALLKEQGIRAVFFMNPPYKNWFLDLNLDEFGRFEKALAQLTPFYDFTGINSITRDPLNFYNPSHFRVSIGNIMIARMLDDTAVKIPSDFGVVVTAETVDAHLQSLRQQAAEEENRAAPAK